ncbi:MAG: phosphopantothenoylcysteine decarboxylase [Planctomycetota bacterium]|nr:phosphopantothenoylcysteine decarboxylase [Planctomycetota bacterium]
MAHILITSGPTRQYIDPVRYLTNASSGQMGKCLASACLTHGHEVTIVSGPVELDYPDRANLISVSTTDEMLHAAVKEFPHVDGVIGAAAPCDYTPFIISDRKLSKTGDGLTLHLKETPDVIATLGQSKQSNQWVVGFALETDDHRFRALRKLEAKCCDLIVLNGPSAMNSPDNTVEIINPQGDIISSCNGSKSAVALTILSTIEDSLMR